MVIKELLKITSFFAALLLSLSFIFTGNAGAIGVSPSRIIVDFEPNLKKNFTFSSVGHPSKTIGVELYIKGDLKDYVTILSETSAVLSPGEIKIFTVELSLPAKIEKPGTHDIRIGAVEVPPDIAESGATVGARAGVEAQLWVKVPYPGKYIEISLDAPDVKLNETVNFVISVSNLGTEDVFVYDPIDIYDPNNIKIATVHTGETEVKTKSIEKLYAQWETKDIEAGIYNAVATVMYDGKSVNTSREFRIGYLWIDIIDIVFNDTKEGDIAKFDVVIKSFWNEKITDIYAELEITDENGKIIDRVKSQSVDLEPWREKTIPVYWDTKGVSVGSYNAKITLYYADKTTYKTVKIEIIAGFEPFLIIVVVLIAVIVILIAALPIYYYKKSGRA